METILEIPSGHAVFRVSGQDPAERLGRHKKLQDETKRYSRFVCDHQLSLGMVEPL
jgi:hypothetical protein